MNRLKQKDLVNYRIGLLLEQGGVCPLCRTKIASHEACLDHDHKTGRIRGVLHRACNSSEGRVMKWAYSSRAKDPYLFLTNIMEYHDIDYNDSPLHPTHLTDNERAIKKLKKRLAKLKTQKGKDRLQAQIDALKEIV